MIVYPLELMRGGWGRLLLETSNGITYAVENMMSVSTLCSV